MSPQKENQEEVTKVEKFKDHQYAMEGGYENTIATRVARATARNPLKCLIGSIVGALIFSAIALIGGDFKIEVDNKGWRSRGTLIANREMQNDLIRRLKVVLFKDEDGSAWDDIETNVLRGYVDLEDREEEEEVSGSDRRQLFIDGCDAEKYYTKAIAKDNLYAVYKTDANPETETKSILEPEVLFEICEAETATQKVLEENGVCGGCDNETECLPPFSLLLVLRRRLDAMGLTCSELREQYTTSVQESFTNDLVECTQGILDTFNPTTQTYDAPAACPPSFGVNLVDRTFGIDGNSMLKHTSSYFITYEVDEEKLYEFRSQYAATDTNIISVAYDTSAETQNEIYVDSLLLQDMALAVGSMLITFIAMGIHTKSFFLTFFGVMQIIFSVPLAYFVYYFIAGLRFFPFLNFIGVFVAAALGADYVFVTVDKWKNARIENPSASTEDIAAIALPDAASAMFLTTSTTAVAFFATTICPVTPILCFALYCGLLIVFNYFMNIFFLFPALCLYDNSLGNGKRNYLCNFFCCSKSIFENTGSESNEEGSEQSTIHKVLNYYFLFLKKFRYAILVLCLIGTGICVWIAFTIKLPDSVDVRLLPEGDPFELHFKWKTQLLSFLLFLSGGSTGEITWGVLPADTGKRNDPDDLTTLVLDDTFDPSTTDAQEYILGFCDELFSTDNAGPNDIDYVCPMNLFDSWLRNETASPDPSNEYVSHCNNADSLPMAQTDFHGCMFAWSQLVGVSDVLAKRGIVKIIRIKTSNSVGWDAPFSVMDNFWKTYEKWMEEQRSIAPPSANKMFHTSGAFWWYDTNISMLQTAIGAAGIALGFSTLVVLLASRSLILTLCSTFCIAYVLAATTASLVGFGWSLGFLESVCFAILIGISCDFVIHFGHAYNHLPGDASKFDRTRFAVIHMGPSIMAAAFTTFAAATVMLFCKVTFFTKFALILLMTIVHATIGSFVIYLVCTVCFGPSEPTKLFDSFMLGCKSKLGCNKEEKEQGDGEKGQALYDGVEKSLSFEKQYDLSKTA